MTYLLGIFGRVEIRVQGDVGLEGEGLHLGSGGGGSVGQRGGAGEEEEDVAEMHRGD